MRFERRNSQKPIRIKIALMIVSIFIITILPFGVKANSDKSNVNRNMMFVQVINYTMPIIKATSFNEEDMAENNFSIGKMLLGIVGLDLSSPMSVVGRELSFLDRENPKENNSINVDFNHFKLDDKQIAKEKDEANPINNTDLNLENKIVEVYNPKLKKSLNTNKPEVLIYHTHTTESYKPGEAISFDNNQNVCSVGDALVNELQSNYGISAINDKTVHDAEAYTQSYARSAVTVDQYLKKYKNFKLIIDLHRDSVGDKKAITMKMNGENVAKIGIVMAKKNPHFDKNMALANKIIDNCNKIFPGFCRGVIYYNYGTRYFNQDKSNNAILVEVGGDINTTDEAKASAKYLARAIAESLNK